MSDRPAPLISLRLPALTLLGPLFGLAVILILFTIPLVANGQAGNFYSLRNLQVILHKSSILIVCSLGMLMIIVSRGIDLSVGSVVALVTVVCMQTYRLTFTSLASSSTEATLLSGPMLVILASAVSIAAGILLGGLCGLVNGLVITRLRVMPFIATLGMLSVARGLAFWLSGRNRLSFAELPRPQWVQSLGSISSAWLIFDPGVWISLLLTVCAFVILRFTVFGRYIYAIGSNEATARLCGIGIERNKLAIYTLAGLLTGWAGVMMFAHGNAGDPNAGNVLELEVIAAVVIGGASLSGGQGTVVGTILGVLLLGVVENGVNFLNVAIEVKYVLIGVIVVVNVALGRWQQGLSEG